MTYRGIVTKGTVVLEPSADLPEGAAVQVSLEETQGADAESSEVWQALKNLPADARLEDVIERVYLFYKIGRGVRQLDSGQGVPHEDARKRFSEWLG